MMNLRDTRRRPLQFIYAVTKTCGDEEECRHTDVCFFVNHHQAFDYMFQERLIPPFTVCLNILQLNVHGFYTPVSSPLQSTTLTNNFTCRELVLRQISGKAPKFMEHSIYMMQVRGCDFYLAGDIPVAVRLVQQHKQVNGAMQRIVFGVPLQLSL